MIGVTSFILAQPKIKFDTTLYDFGNVLEANTIYASYKVTNIGTQPLSIYNVQTSGGGLSGSWPTKPILPGKSAEITLLYESKGRVGPISKSANVFSNAINAKSTTELKVRGRVISNRTSIKVSSNKPKMRTIPFGAVDTLYFTVVNTGEAPLYLNDLLDNTYAAPIDLLYTSYSVLRFNAAANKPAEKLQYGLDFVNPRDTLRVQLCLRNTLGNAGPKERYFYFKYNTDDTLKYIIKVNYTGAPGKHKVYEKNDLNNHSLYEYENGQIKKHTTYVCGHARTMYYFKDGDLIRSIDIHPVDGKQTEYNYKNGLIVNKREIRNKGKKY